MEIQVTRLREILKLLKPVVPRKPTLESLKNVLFVDGKAVATDLTTMVIVTVPEASEAALIPFTAVSDMLDYVPGDAILKMESDGSKVELSWADGAEKASYAAIDPESFPSLPTFVPTEETAMDGDSLMAAFGEALPYVAKDESRPVLQALTMVLGSPVEVAAGDGFRMSHQVLPHTFPEEKTILIPSESVRILLHLFKSTPRTPPPSDSLTPILVAQKQILFALDDAEHLRVTFGPRAEAIVKLVSGTPPAWLKLIPKADPALEVQLFATQLEVAVRRVRNVALQNSGIVRMEFQEGSVRLSAKYDVQEVATTVDTVLSQGYPFATACNVKYLMAYVKGKEGLITISGTDPKAPLMFQHSPRAPRVLIMPMFVKPEGEAKAEEENSEASEDESQETPAEGEPEAETEDEDREDGGSKVEEPADVTPPAPVGEAAKPARRKKEKVLS